MAHTMANIIHTYIGTYSSTVLLVCTIFKAKCELVYFTAAIGELQNVIITQLDVDFTTIWAVSCTVNDIH